MSFPRRAPLWLHWAGPGPEARCRRGWRSFPVRPGRSQWEQARQRREPQRGQQPEACLRQEERPGFPRPPAPCLARRFVTCTPPGKGTWPPGLGLPGGPAVSPWALKCPRVLVHQSPCTPAPGVRACVVCVAWGVSAQALPPGAPPHLASVHPCPQAECIPLTWQRVTCVHLQGAVTVERWGGTWGCLWGHQ